MPINSFLYPGAKVVPPFTVANSCRFDDGSSDSMNRSNGTPTNLKKFSISLWFKRPEPGLNKYLITGYDDEDNRTLLQFSSDQLLFQNTTGGSNNTVVKSNAMFRDPSAWYHFCVIVDTTQSTDSNRVKMYVNGSQVTSLASSTYPNQNTDMELTDSANSIILNQKGDNSDYNSGYYAEVVVLDGTAASITDFGQFNEDTPTVWEPKDVTGLTFGNNGFYLDFEDSSNLGNDVSGGTDFTVSNLTALDQSTDTCSNNGCTWNLLYRNQAAFSQGSLVYQAPSSNPVFGSLTTFGVTKGKWYAECKYHAGSNHYGIIGVADEVFATLNDLGSATNTDLGKTGSALGSDPNDCTVAYVINTGKIRNNNNNQNYGSGGGDGDIINIALDRDNRKVYFGINGTYENSGNPSSGSNGFDLSSQVTGDLYFLGVTNDTGSSETILDFNFGGGFGQTAVSTGNSDANGYGNFEYAVPSGFYAWNSKNLAEFG